MRILLPTDGSDYANEAAAQCGELIVNLKNVVIKIITVSDYIVDFDSDAFISEGEFVKLLEREIRKRSTDILAETEKIICYKNENVQIEKEFFIGTAKKLIVEEANKWKPDLIVVGSHGYGFWTRALLGSVSDAIVHHAPCSVLVVRNK